jgi:hypothetical protein
LNGHIILTDTSITTILAPEMTYTPKKRDSILIFSKFSPKFVPQYPEVVAFCKTFSIFVVSSLGGKTYLMKVFRFYPWTEIW